MTERKSSSDTHILKDAPDNHADSYEREDPPRSIVHSAMDQGEKQRRENVQRHHLKRGHFAGRHLQNPGRGVDSNEQPERKGNDTSAGCHARGRSAHVEIDMWKRTARGLGPPPSVTAALPCTSPALPCSAA